MAVFEHDTADTFHVLGVAFAELFVEGDIEPFLGVFHASRFFWLIITLGQGGLAVLGVHLIGVHPLLHGEIKHSLITACGFHECTRRGFKILGDDWVDAFGPFVFGIGIDQGGELLLGLGQLGGDEGAHGVGGGVGVHFPRPKDGVVFAFATEEPLPGFANLGLQANSVFGIHLNIPGFLHFLNGPLKLASVAIYT